MINLEQFCDISPKFSYLPDFDCKKETEWYGVKRLWYEGAVYRGKKTKVYACIGYPDMKEGERFPAIVLVHGGGGHAYPEWVKQWNRRGFAAIAMDTTGFFPSEKWRGLTGTEEGGSQDTGKYVRELYKDLYEDGYTVGPNNASMTDFDLPTEDQWAYHAVADTILAHNILRADKRVDPDKIGICGISWGGVVVSLSIGYDDRYAFAIPIYGSGHLDLEPSPNLPKIFKEPTVKKLWSAAERFDRVRFPVLWKCFAGDVCFSLVANSRSYLDTKETGSFLSVSFDWSHSHWHGWHSDEPYRFAQSTVCGRLPFVKIVNEPDGFEKIDLSIDIPKDFSDISASILYLTEPMEYDENNKMTSEWKRFAAKISENRVTAEIPSGVCCCFVELKGFADGVFYLTSSSLIEMKG